MLEEQQKIEEMETLRREQERKARIKEAISNSTEAIESPTLTRSKYNSSPVLVESVVSSTSTIVNESQRKEQEEKDRILKEKEEQERSKAREIERRKRQEETERLQREEEMKAIERKKRLESIATIEENQQEDPTLEAKRLAEQEISDIRSKLNELQQSQEITLHSLIPSSSSSSSSSTTSTPTKEEKRRKLQEMMSTKARFSDINITLTAAEEEWQKQREEKRRQRYSK